MQSIFIAKPAIMLAFLILGWGETLLSRGFLSSCVSPRHHPSFYCGLRANLCPGVPAHLFGSPTCTRPKAETSHTLSREGYQLLCKLILSLDVSVDMTLDATKIEKKQENYIINLARKDFVHKHNQRSAFLQFP